MVRRQARNHPLTWRAFLALVAGAIIIAGALASMLPLHAFALDCPSGYQRASWYGMETCRGRRTCLTANGEHFTGKAMTAAHRSWAFGTRVRVTTLAGSSVTVRINDRGPFVAGRAIDLSEAAARALGTRGAGVACVRLTRL